MAGEDKKIEEQRTQEDRKFDLHKTLLIVIGTIGVPCIIGIFTISNQIFSSTSILTILFPVISAGVFYYFGRKQKEKMEELAGMKRITKTREKSTEPFLNEFVEFIDEFKSFIEPSDNHSIYNLIKKMNEVAQKNKNLEKFSDDYIEMHWQDEKRKLYAVEKRLVELTIEKKEIFLLIDDFINILMTYTEFCILFEKFVSRNKLLLPDYVRKQYLEDVREEYNDLFAGFRDFSKRIWRDFGEKKEIPNLKLPLIWV